MSADSARGVPARIGIAFLNLVMPGLGVLRVQRGRPAALFLVAPWVIYLLVVLGYRLLPTLTFESWLVLVGLAVIAALAVYIGAMVVSWRASACRRRPAPWWSRWYGMLAIAVAAVAVTWPIPDLAPLSYRSFYLPSEGMVPTLLRNDRLFAAVDGPYPFRRGDVILFRVRDAVYVKRIAALPGDRIAVAGGVVILNGRPVPQRLLEVERVPPDMYGNQARRLAEQFPGESAPHEILDRGESAGDELAEQQVAPDHLFVLGDNRDLSADSRYPREQWGVEQLPIDAVLGPALFYLWGPSGRIGEPLNR